MSILDTLASILAVAVAPNPVLAEMLIKGTSVYPLPGTSTAILITEVDGGDDKVIVGGNV